MNIYKNSDFDDDCSNNCNCSKDCADHVYCTPQQIPIPVPGPTGPQGPRGVPGPAGPSATIHVGYTVTGDPGTAASVTNSGTSSNAVLDFAIPQGVAGPTGVTGSTGVTGPTGATGIISPDSSAFFASFGLPYANGSLIPYGEVVSDPTRQITLADATHIALSPGDYLVSYHVSALLRTAGYLQVTPFFNGSSHIEFGIYFKTAGEQSSGCGSQSIIVSVTDQTLFSLTFNSNSISTDGTATLTFLRLNRPA